MKRKISLLAFLFIFLNGVILAFPNVVNVAKTIKFRPFAGGEGEEVFYQAGSNAISSPSTSGKAGAFAVALAGSLATLQSDNTRIYSPSFSVVCGLDENNDVTISLPYTYNDKTDGTNDKGFSDISLGINNNFMKEDDFGIGVGFGLTVNFPSGEDEVTSVDNKVDFTLTSKFEKNFGSNALNISLSYSYDMAEEGHRAVGAGFAYSRGLSDKLAASIEMSIPDVEKKHSEFTNILFLGIRYSLPFNIGSSFIYGRNIADGKTRKSALKDLFIASLSYSF